ncbi:hypothetical protein Goshw_005238 [Gossypium schwendimanii]|uniref:Uncharacterized protein n=1 Tax=Gossypium schwendimanii TaxID=34291 RepID=A0A7J9KQI9_GOSSC|nr:hypothetical protein [Gossypium schwendimanii]
MCQWLEGRSFLPPLGDDFTQKISIKEWNKCQQEATAALASSQRKNNIGIPNYMLDMFGATHPEHEEEAHESEEEGEDDEEKRDDEMDFEEDD